VWTRHFNKEKVCMSIGAQMKQFLEINGDPLGYVAHNDSIKRTSSKNRYQV
jgi:hypothetical protein